MATRKEVLNLIQSGKVEQAAALLLSIPRRDWENLIGNTKESGWQDLEHHLDGLAQNASMLSEYLGQRGSYGCGDHGHEDALKAANSKLKKIRQAMGYTHP